MLIELAARLKAKGLSNRTAGRRVLDAWKKRDPRERDLPKPASIAVKLGELQRGTPTWWNNHPHALEALASLLDCLPDDLVALAPAAAEAISFGEFSELPPLQADEDPCALDAHGWLGSQALHALNKGVHAWFLAPAGTGKTLALWYLRQRASGSITTFTARTLAEAARESDPAMPLIVEVQLADAITDVTALGELTLRRTNTCVLAPFRRPSLGAKASSRWIDHRFSPCEGWREQLIRWVHGRLPEPVRLDVTGLLDWLEDVDAAGELFATPGELLPIVAWCYRKNSKPTKKTSLEALADEHLARLFDAAGQRHPWLRSEGQKVVEALVRRRIEDVDLPNAPLPLETWVALLPADVAPGASEADVRRQIDAVARERTADVRRRKADEAIKALSASRAREAILLLVEQGVLRTQVDGHLDIFPTWARRALDRRAILEQFRGETCRWGIRAAEASRKFAFDEVLDSLAPRSLVDMAAKISVEPAGELHVVVAIEALFAALGRRMIGGWEPAPEHVPSLQALGQLQAELLLKAVEVDMTRPPIPITRFNVEYNRMWQTFWVFEAWAFSLKVPRPSPVPSVVRWSLPGWADDLRLVDAPLGLHFPLDDQAKSQQERARVANRVDLAAISRQVLEHCMDSETPERVEGVFIPWLIIDGLPGGGKPHMEHSKAAVAHGDFLAELLEAEDAEKQVRIVSELWPAMKAHAGGHPLWGLTRLLTEAPRLLGMVAAHLPRELLERDLASAQIHGEVEQIEMLPSALQRSVLRGIANRIGTTAEPTPSELASYMTVLDDEDVDLLVQFASDKYSVGHAAACRLFTLDPARGLREAQAALQQASPIAWIWFYSAPKGHWRALLDLLETYGAERTSWGNRWIARMLSRAGTEAPRMFRLLQRGGHPSPGRRQG
jgi:hypothetical protein